LENITKQNSELRDQLNDATPETPGFDEFGNYNCFGQGDCKTCEHKPCPDDHDAAPSLEVEEWERNGCNDGLLPDDDDMLVLNAGGLPPINAMLGKNLPESRAAPPAVNDPLCRCGHKQSLHSYHYAGESGLCKMCKCDLFVKEKDAAPKPCFGQLETKPECFQCPVYTSCSKMAFPDETPATNVHPSRVCPNLKPDFTCNNTRVECKCPACGKAHPKYSPYRNAAPAATKPCAWCGQIGCTRSGLLCPDCNVVTNKKDWKKGGDLHWTDEFGSKACPNCGHEISEDLILVKCDGEITSNPDLFEGSCDRCGSFPGYPDGRCEKCRRCSDDNMNDPTLEDRYTERKNMTFAQKAELAQFVMPESRVVTLGKFVARTCARSPVPVKCFNCGSTRIECHDIPAPGTWQCLDCNIEWNDTPQNRQENDK
jgi:hypothetical protein